MWLSSYTFYVPLLWSHLDIRCISSSALLHHIHTFNNINWKLVGSDWWAWEGTEKRNSSTGYTHRSFPSGWGINREPNHIKLHMKCTVLWVEGWTVLLLFTACFLETPASSFTAQSPSTIIDRMFWWEILPLMIVTKIVISDKKSCLLSLNNPFCPLTVKVLVS